MVLASFRRSALATELLVAAPWRSLPARGRKDREVRQVEVRGHAQGCGLQG